MANAIRDATLEDAPQLVHLLDELGHPAGEVDIRARLERIAGLGNGNRALVAVRDGRIAGLAVLHVTPVLHRATDVGRITALVVRSTDRGHGVGAALVEAGERVLAALGCARIEITTNHPLAHPFYRRIGYTDEGIRFAKSLAR